MRVTLIYMAAGNSRRFGSNKLLHKIDGKCMYLHLLERLVRICKRHDEWQIVVVTQYQEIYAEVLEFRKQGFSVCPVLSSDSRKGASYSVRAGIKMMEEIDRAEGRTTEACVFFAADQPYLTEESAGRFLEEMEKKRVFLGCVCHDGQKGNPVWFSKEYFSELRLLEGDFGGRRVLAAHEENAVCFEIGNALELVDIDGYKEILK